MKPYTLYPQDTSDGAVRRVGIELEYMGVSIEEASQLLADFFDGEVTLKNRHCHLIDTKEFGEFRVELDCILMQKLGEEIIRKRDLSENSFLDEAAENILTPVVSQVVPYEIVTPPMNVKGLKLLEEAISQLHNKGAVGTQSSLLYAFGLQINAELVNSTSEHILSVMQAYALLHDYLAEEMHMDKTRWATRYALPYPAAYRQKILQPDYAPTIDQLIDDYLQANPTRNRGLDMLPIFTWIDEARVRNIVKDELVKARPAYHFRLPDCRIGDANWTLRGEMQWWQEIEYLAAHQHMRRQMADAYLEKPMQWWQVGSNKDWNVEVEEWLQH